MTHSDDLPLVVSPRRRAVTARVHVLDWKPLRRNTLRGFAKVQFASGLIVSDIGVHAAGSKVWAAPPGKPMLDTSGTVLRDEGGKIRYSPVVSFMNHGTRSSWSRQVIDALREAHPEALADMEPAA